MWDAIKGNQGLATKLRKGRDNNHPGFIWPGPIVESMDVKSNTLDQFFTLELNMIAWIID